MLLGTLNLEADGRDALVCRHRLTLTRSCAPYVRIIDLGVVDPPDAHVSVLPGCGRVRATDDLVLARLVRSPI